MACIPILLLLSLLPWRSHPFTPRILTFKTNFKATNNYDRKNDSISQLSIFKGWASSLGESVTKASSYQVLEKQTLAFFDSLQDECKLATLQDLLLSEVDDSPQTTAPLWNDVTAFYDPLKGSEKIERYLRIELLGKQDRRRAIRVTDVVIDTAARKTAVLIEEKGLRSIVVLSFDADSDRIARVDWSTESRTKTGEGSLRVLSAVSKLLSNDDQRVDESIGRSSLSISSDMTPPEQYYAAWNVRDIDAAASVFTEDAIYDDTAFSDPLDGADAIRNHLTLCSDLFPTSFQFRADSIIKDDRGKKLAVEWHVESNDKELPFTKGLSMYELEGKKIKKGIDFVDSTPIKTAQLERFVSIVKCQIAQEPVRLVPWAVWFSYMYIVFFSDGILPGANALLLEERTWKEVLDLSLNFFLVAPTLGLPFSPVVHPMLEAVFNVLLSWAALFVGFASDDRREKPSVMPFGPTVIGMQFLTSAFYLPYLATRTTETDSIPKLKQDGPLYNVAESRFLAPPLLLVGSYSILWGVFARADEFGSRFQDRWSSFIDLLSIDRVGSSFLVDLAIFGLFQCWWIDDDLKRRGISEETDLSSPVRSIGKFVPFFGLGIYLMLRPQLKTSDEKEAS